MSFDVFIVVSGLTVYMIISIQMTKVQTPDAQAPCHCELFLCACSTKPNELPRTTILKPFGKDFTVRS